MIFGTQIFELWVDGEIKVYMDQKGYISFWIYVKIRYENFHCSVIVDNMKEDWNLLENYGSFKGSPMCYVRYEPSDLKRAEKYESLNGT